MRKIIFIAVILFTSLNVFADVSASCGSKEPLMKRVFSDSEQIRLKCIDDFYAKQKQDQADLVKSVKAAVQEQKEILAKSAYESNSKYLRVSCDSPNGQRDPALVKKCQNDLALFNGLVMESYHLESWESKGLAAESNSSYGIPCPEKATLDAMQAVRKQKPELYKAFLHCR